MWPSKADGRGDRHVHIGARGERRHLDHHLGRRAQRRHQQGRQILARLAGVERRGAAAQGTPLDPQRHVPLGGEVLDLRAQPAQRVDQRSHGALAQAGDAVEPPAAGDHGEGGDQEAEHGAGVAAEHLHLALRAADRRQADLVLPLLDAEAAAAEGGEEQAGVLGDQRPLDHHRRAREERQVQIAVGEALRRGHPQAPARPPAARHGDRFSRRVVDLESESVIAKLHSREAADRRDPPRGPCG